MLASYERKDVAHIWFTQWKENMGADAAPLTWELFGATFFVQVRPKGVDRS